MIGPSLILTALHRQREKTVFCGLVAKPGVTLTEYLFKIFMNWIELGILLKQNK